MLPGYIGNANSFALELGDLDGNDDEMKHRKAASDATAQKENFALKCFEAHVETRVF